MLVVLAVAFAAVTARLVYIQGPAAARYVALGENERVRTVALPAERGALFDREGQDLALSIPQTTVWADPHLVTDPMGEAGRLAPVLGVPAPDLQALLSKDAGFVYLARKVTDPVASQVRALKLDGIAYLDEPERFLPAGNLAAPIVGQVGLDNNGLSGLELQYDKQLSGQPGELIVERDPKGHDIPGGLHRFQPATKGQDLILTVDRSLEYQTEQALATEIQHDKAKGGMAIVMDSKSGEILAMANLVAGPNQGDPPQPAPSDTALTAVYEPGSVNKVVTLSGALEEGIIHPDDHLMVPDNMRVGDYTFRDNEAHPTESMSITDILANSSNIGTITIAQKLGKDKIDHYLRAYGFGKPTGLGYPGESAGLLLDPAKWSGSSIGSVPIGQSVAVTAMQMIAAYNTIADGGTYIAPKLVKGTVDAHGVRHATPPSVRHRVISARTAKQVTAMLNEVVRVGTGTAAAIDGYTVAGKTGTARVPENGGYKAGVYVASFAGFVPSQDPALTAMVVIDEPQTMYGGTASAPVFAAIARYALREFRIPPPPAVPVANVPAASQATAGVDEPVPPAPAAVTSPPATAPP
ncbi:MAG TPA: penicillin-binding protein 2, partial [Acidimicrobiales bacterium]